MASPLNLTISAKSKFSTNADGTKTNNSNGTENNQELQYKKDGAYTTSLFGDSSTGENSLAFYPSALKEGTDQEVAASRLGTIHSDDTNDTSITSLINYTSKYQAMTLKAIDFAYLKNVGVYPNNRLIVARRFRQPVSDDLTTYRGKPISTLISWVNDGDDFLEVKFGEQWGRAEADLTGVLNDMGSEFGIGEVGGEGRGKMAGGGVGAIPLPGFTEGLQYQVMKKLGLTDADAQNVPSGNPNLVREAMQRLTIEKGKAGAGLKPGLSIKMVVEYEQKFIAGVDPTMSWLDIIANALSFGTSNSECQFKGAVGDGLKSLLDKLSKGDVEGALTEFLKNMIDAIAEVGSKLIDEMIQAGSPGDEADDPDAKALKNILTNFVNAANSLLTGVISKYKVKIIGIVNAITGQPSTPWHVTIGNPKKPILCSGDMHVDEVVMTLGPTLAFNDLPSSLKLEFTLTSARTLGKQEIFKKLNTGKGRSYDSAKDIFAKNLIVTGSKQPDPSASINAASSTTGQQATLTNTNTGKTSQIGVNAADGSSTLAGKDTSAIQQSTVTNNSLNTQANNIASQNNTDTNKVASGSYNRPVTVFDETENGGTVTFLPKP